MGFLLSSLGLLNLFIAITVFARVRHHRLFGRALTRRLASAVRGPPAAGLHPCPASSASGHYILPSTPVTATPSTLHPQFFGDDWTGLFEAITGYGLGGSSIALFGRVGGGIYTKVSQSARGPGTKGTPPWMPGTPGIALMRRQSVACKGTAETRDCAANAAPFATHGSHTHR
jgi:hypothetical protein